ncbi:unnamed protein product [Caenorhabditis auriculariae]|uniref:Probable tRNA (uracil-O(2)-)-methyltransferase n=1 Tax=Caenorhabditis auriculariae TaxID=2777116 RepID=A0A8S1HNK0_9PELO|nr:unnamed protein product [Caenorhabditis auriculariae]
MVKRLFVSGLNSFTTVESFRDHFERFGSLYECLLPLPTRYDVIDQGPDDADLNASSNLRFRIADQNQKFEDDFEVISFDSRKHETFERYTKLIGEGELFLKKKTKTCVGYGFVTFVDREGFKKCIEEDVHIIDGVECTVELYKDEEDISPTTSLRSKRLFVSFYPLPRLTDAEIKGTFGPFGKIKDVEFVKDNEGPLHFCLITFTTEQAVEKCLKSDCMIRGFRLFLKRAVTREGVKLAEQKSREDADRLEKKLHGFAGCLDESTASTLQYPDYFLNSTKKSLNAKEAVEQANFQTSFSYDPSAMAGFGPLLPDTESSSYGYGMCFETWNLLCESTAEYETVPDALALFEKLISLWREQAQSYNRRIAGTVLVPNDSENVSEVIEKLPSNVRNREFQIRKFILKSDQYSSRGYEVSYFEEDFIVRFWPVVLDEVRHPHIPQPYSIACVFESENRLKLQIFSLSRVSLDNYCYLKSSAFIHLFKWFSHLDPNKEGRKTNALMEIERYTLRYRQIKELFGRPICESWEEKTDPQKFVFEDCAITTYLVELWDLNRQPKPKKSSLISDVEMAAGYGVDVRSRRIWSSTFVDDDLREVTVDPTNFDAKDGVFDEGVDYLIGNHSDELTPWMPIMAARLNCNFFLLPCCPFDFYGKYMSRICHQVCQTLGYDVRVDRMSIPSTKRLCLVCTIPSGGLAPNLNEVIESLIKPPDQLVFTARPKKIEVKNCVNIPLTDRHRMTKKFFSRVMSASDEVRNGWHCGGVVPLSELVILLTDEEKKLMKEQDGGLQTFLKNQNQVFHVYGGNVRIRDLRDAQTSKTAKKKQKTKTNPTERRAACWMAANHPDGCPLGLDFCRYIH